LPSKTRHSAILTLLLLVITMQPVLAFGQILDNRSESSSVSSPAMMECCQSGVHTSSDNATHGMICGDMTSTDCTLAASLGNCGSAVSALASETTGLSAQTATGPRYLHPHDGYLSIILDTLTPPPNSSKA
jgi:hypothetical protein